MDPQLVAEFELLRSVRQSAENPAMWVADKAKTWYPKCECWKAAAKCWYLPTKMMSEAYDFVEQWHETHCPKPTTHKGNGRYQGAFAFTLTASPKDGYSVSMYIAAAQKIMSQKSQPVIKYAWWLEYKGFDADGVPIHPHIHGMYETADGRKIEDKHFRRAWPIWMEKDPETKKVKLLGAGFRGGYHRPVKSEEKYTDYIKKDGGISESSDNF